MERPAATADRSAPTRQEDAVPLEVTVTTIPALRLVALTRTLDRDEVGRHLEEMFDTVARGIGAVPGALDTPVAVYDETAAGLVVSAGYAGAAPAPDGCEVVELPQDTAACSVHLGEMSRVGESWRALHRWVEAHGYRHAGPCREVYVRAASADQADWVTELQQPVAR